jgi:small subunit ribosomal protein S4
MARVRQRKKYDVPRHPWRADVLEAELRLMGTYGLRNKRELWRQRYILSKARAMARSLLGLPKEERVKLESDLLGRLHRLGLIPEDGTLDDVLNLTIEDLLERRLQTRIFRLGLAKSIQQARQLITHGHIMVNNRKVTSPSYLVKREEEGSITYTPSSPFSNPNHSLRKAINTT